jgi:hypothetical protein
MGRINNDAAFFMSYVRGDDRGQAALLPAAIEDYVAADAPVRVIDAFVDRLDVIGLGFGRSVPAATGRPFFFVAFTLAPKRNAIAASTNSTSPPHDAARTQKRAQWRGQHLA